MDVVSFLSSEGVILDVRSPIEFAHAHVPSALSFPLFSDDERREVGTLYKNVGKEAAFDRGLFFVHQKIPDFVLRARELCKKFGTLKIMCARGGMRSASLEWLFSMAGLPTCRLEGGYKAFRAFILLQLQKSYPLVVIGGYTGSGKTEMLKELKKKNFSVLDLEELANHKGSSFGSLGPQPSNEQFENELACALFHFQGDKLYVEDESRLIGRIKIPDAFYEQMRKAPFCELKVTKEKRVERILKDYGTLSKDELIQAFLRIEKRLGSENFKRATLAVEMGDLSRAVEIALDYYDKAYEKMIQIRERNNELSTL